MGGRMGSIRGGRNVPGWRCIASPTPALFGHQSHTTFASLLSHPKRLAAATPRDAVALTAQLGGDIIVQPQCFPDLVLLDPAERAVLIDWLDAEHSGAGAEIDLHRTVSTATLTDLIGTAAVGRLAAAFGGPYNLVKLRRVAVHHGSFVEFPMLTATRGGRCILTWA